MLFLQLYNPQEQVCVPSDVCRSACERCPEIPYCRVKVKVKTEQPRGAGAEPHLGLLSVTATHVCWEGTAVHFFASRTRASASTKPNPYRWLTGKTGPSELAPSRPPNARILFGSSRGRLTHDLHDPGTGHLCYAGLEDPRLSQEPQAAGQTLLRIAPKSLCSTQSQPQPRNCPT